MDRNRRYVLAVAPALALAATVANTTGCSTAGFATTSDSGCTITTFVDPTSVTLDHTDPNNFAVFNTGYKYTGPAGACVIPQVVTNYYFLVSDPLDANIIGDSGVTCVHASAAPIKVYSNVLTYVGPTNVATYIPTNFPSATLTCK